MTILVNEIFYSIQGESAYSGLPCVFIRLTGCNLRCSYCDTKYAYEEGSAMNIGRILYLVNTYNCPLIEVTGGEPLRQSETPQLIYILLENKFQVLLETNGCFDLSPIDKRCVKIMDIKCPSSGHHDKTDLENIQKLNHKDQIKFVIQNRIDYEYAKKIIRLECPGFPKNQILFSPVHQVMPPDQLAKWILEDHLCVRFQLQLHKMIWPRIERGV